MCFGGARSKASKPETSTRQGKRQWVRFCVPGLPGLEPPGVRDRSVSGFEIGPIPTDKLLGTPYVLNNWLTLRDGCVPFWWGVKITLGGTTPYEYCGWWAKSVRTASETLE